MTKPTVSKHWRKQHEQITPNLFSKTEHNKAKAWFRGLYIIRSGNGLDLFSSSGGSWGWQTLSSRWRSVDGNIKLVIKVINERWDSVTDPLNVTAHRVQHLILWTHTHRWTHNHQFGSGIVSGGLNPVNASCSKLLPFKRFSAILV